MIQSNNNLKQENYHSTFFIYSRVSNGFRTHKVPSIS